ncbi:MAG: DUF368 domain-containing protein [Parvibaculum sp.]|nr:DUF368 domain-containing protein [Parvibaculum sp.]
MTGKGEMAPVAEWRWRPFLLWAGAAALLALSFVAPPALALWRALDTSLFTALNGSIGWGEGAALFWAAANENRFRVLALLVLTFAWLVHLGGEKGTALHRDMALGLVTLAVTLLLLALAAALPAQIRDAPIVVWTGANVLGDLVSWSDAGRSETARLPALAAVAAGALTALLWTGFGRGLGLGGLALLLALALPRIASGDEWASDHIAGGGIAALAALALARGTPLLHWVYRAALVPTDVLLNRWDRIVERFSIEGRENFHPARQVLRGMCVGAADLVPGVSGGTMALILGIYQRLIGAIAHFDAKLLGNLRRLEITAAARHVDILFLIPIGIGVLLALIIFSRVVPLSVLITEYPEIMFGFFFGLIAASIVGLLAHVETGGMKGLVWLALGAGFGLAAATLVPVQTPDASWFIFLAGMAAIAAMLVPGISGSFVLLILGKYTDAIDALGRLDFSFLLPLLGGVVSGALVFSRAISWLLGRFYRQTMLTVIGILAGSLLAVWPFKERHYETIGGKERLVSADAYVPLNLDATVAGGVIAILAGILLYRFLDRLAQHSGDEAA